MAKPPAGQMHLFFRVTAAGVPTPAAVQTSIFDALPDLAPPSRFQPWQREARKAMSSIRTTMQASPDGVGERWAEALRRAYPGAHQAKRIAQAFACDARTAQSWLAGQHPQVKHLCRAGLVHGAGFVMAVLVPGSDAAAGARLDDHLTALEARLAGLRRDVAELRGGGGG